MTTVTGSIVGLDGPVDVSASLSGLARWGDDLIDRWDGHRVLRTGRVEGRTIAFRATMMGTIEAPALALTAAAQESGQTAEALARSMFVVAPPEFAELCARDLVIGELDAHHPGVRPLLQPDPLTALVRSISAQQVNLRWAATVRRRIAERYGRRHELEGEPVYSLEASALAQASFDDLRALQLTGAKARAVIGCARAALDGRLDAAELRGLADDAVVERLLPLPGIGPWSADWFLARTLGRPRVVAGDLGVRKAVGLAYFDGGLPSEMEVRAATAHWGPAAGVAQQLLLHALVERTLGRPSVTPARR